MLPWPLAMALLVKVLGHGVRVVVLPARAYPVEQDGGRSGRRVEEDLRALPSGGYLFFTQSINK